MWCKYFVWNDEPSNDFVVSVLNTFKREVPHLLPTFSIHGVKMVVLDEVNVELKLLRIENDMLKLKIQQAEEVKMLKLKLKQDEEVKNNMKRVARLYKSAFVSIFCLLLYDLAIV